MKCLNRTAFLLCVGAIITVLPCENGCSETLWVPTFYAVQAREDVPHPVSNAFCLSHTPNTFKTTIQQIKKGVQAENGVYIQYLSYTTKHKGGLGFNQVKAKLWLESAQGKVIWSTPLVEYQQNLSDQGVTNVVWSTPQCKGKFIGVPVG